MFNPLSVSTPDLCDQYEDDVQVVEPLLSHYGAVSNFYGSISTVQCFEDNSLVAQQVKSPGLGRVLVVDGGASMRCSLLGDQLAAAALSNGWAGIVINGCLRDVEIIAPMAIGIMAIAAIPRKTVKAGKGSLGYSGNLCWSGICARSLFIRRSKRCYRF